MGSKLIKLEDGVLIEVEALVGQERLLSAFDSEKVNKKWTDVIEQIQKFATRFNDVWNRLHSDSSAEEATIKLGFNLSGQGDLYIAKLSAGATIEISIKYGK